MKTRFAPSPTGFMHFGNLRTALFNFLLAKKNKAELLLRIEDTDKERSKQEFIADLITDLERVGIKIADKIEYQSKQTAVYEKYYKELEEKKLAYPCFCTDEQLKLARKQQLRAGFPPRYNGTCRKLTQTEIEERFKAGKKATLRLHMPDGEVIEFEDLIKGKQRFESKDIGDFVIRRTDGSAPFMFANAIDDSVMEVTHALRGDDHITNTPRQVYLLQVLGLRAPNYGHFPLIYGMDGAPLSKRNGSAAVRDLLNQGYLPLALINYLARLGHYYKDNAFMSMEELADNFALQNVNKAPAKHDIEHLKHWQKEAITKETSDNLWQIISEYFNTNNGEDNNYVELLNLIPQDKSIEFINVIKANILMPKDAVEYITAFFATKLNFSDDALAVISSAKQGLFKYCYEQLNSGEVKTYQELLDSVKEQFAIKGKELFMPIRIAITGIKHGPDLGQIFELMGIDRVASRFKDASNKQLGKTPKVYA